MALIVSNWFQIVLVQRILTKSGVTLAQIRSNDTRQQLVNGGHAIVAIIAGILVLRWIYIAYKNLPALGAVDLKFTPRWVVGFFLLPVLSLYRPYQAVAEIWRVSKPDYNASTGTKHEAQPIERILIFWWLSWLIVGILAVIGLGINLEKTIVSLQRGTWLTLVSNVMDIVAGVLFIQILRKLDTWQHEKFSSQQTDFQYNRKVGVPGSDRRLTGAYLSAPLPPRFIIRRVPVSPANEAAIPG